MAETAGYEMQSWMTTASAQVRGVVFVAALMLVAFVIWLLAVSLRKLWPTWPSPYSHAQRLEDAPTATGYVPAASSSMEIRKRGDLAWSACLRNLEAADGVRLGARAQAPCSSKWGLP